MHWHLAPFVFVYCFVHVQSKIFNTTVSLISIDVPDGKLSDGSSCSNNKCSLSLAVCIDPLESVGFTACKSWKKLPQITTSKNYFNFAQNVSYGDWHNPMNISLTTNNQTGFYFKCNLFQMENSELEIDKFILLVSLEDSETMEYTHNRSNIGPVQIKFAWTNPSKTTTTTSSTTSISPTSTQPGHHSKFAGGTIGAIVGGSVGGMVVVFLVVAGIYHGRGHIKRFLVARKYATFREDDPLAQPAADPANRGQGYGAIDGTAPPSTASN